jgi:hypothetical protein
MEFQSLNNKRNQEKDLSKLNINDVANKIMYGGLEYRDLSQDMKENKELLMKILYDKPRSFMFASEKLRADKDVVKMAISQSGENFRKIAPELKNDKEIALLGIKKLYSNYEHLPLNLQKDYDVIKKVIESKSDSIYKDKITPFLEHIKKRFSRKFIVT